MATTLPSRRGQPRALPRRPRPWRKGASVLVVLVLIAIFGMLAAAIPSVVDNFRSVSRLYYLTPRAAPLNPTNTRLHLDLIALDEWQGTVTLRVSGSRVCSPACGTSESIVLVAAQGSVLGLEGLPPSAAVTFSRSAGWVTQTVTLPIHGAPLRYPFDAYSLRLGVIPEQVAADGMVRMLTPAEARGAVSLTLHEHIPGTAMDTPTILDPQRVPIPDTGDQYAVVADLRFQRPLYMRALTVALVLLVGAAAAYAVLLRPLSNLLTDAGGLVLSVWAIRSILAGNQQPGSTALDLALLVVIVFLLGGVAVRMLFDLGQHSGVGLLRRAARRAAPPQATASPSATPANGRPPSPASAREAHRPTRHAHRPTSPRKLRER